MATTRKFLDDNVTHYRKQLQAATAELARFDALPENNVFQTMDTAHRVLEDRLGQEAFDDCEGAGNCGNDEYTQEFIVSDVHYIAKLECEYGRHDKTYYFVDSSTFTVTPK